MQIQISASNCQLHNKAKSAKFHYGNNLWNTRMNIHMDTNTLAKVQDALTLIDVLNSRIRQCPKFRFSCVEQLLDIKRQLSNDAKKHLHDVDNFTHIEATIANINGTITEQLGRDDWNTTIK